ncbi:F0F1 ATP synthase subunit A [Clavibacter tessellarius]|uniref:ATP synthase subunit a n=1 Tax=Clavibacter tessellarius TaxID=31965 RepID=A0A225CC19_9MICO|nr:F0F1 ATP synthase subunit A [Clavibacter michiganensis]MBT1635701.1 F0F1 ATP synthase subunit A [Clavibacter michiganensis]OQJ64218.1 ATP synthase F0 subunit A [Clavibacter michiganensis subsp. tessellarius]UKF32813.1 F0F1 ATP synthase subunit A [Clavibacter michiganensis subsp. tessellarius]
MITLAAEDSGEGFHAPTIGEFFPPIAFFEGTGFDLNRIMLIRLLVLAVLVVVFVLGTRKLTLVPGRAQNLMEMSVDFVRVNIAEDILGKKDGKRFLPILATIFFLVVGMNVTGIIPFLNIAGTSVIGLPMLLAVIAYITFIYAGIKDRGVGFFKNSLFPAGAPWPIYILLTPIEFLSTFIIRPVALTLRLLMNMVAGHLLLVLCFSATWFFLFESQGALKFLGAGTLVLGFAFTLFELLVAVLQAYIFALLTAVYIQLAVAEEH